MTEATVDPVGRSTLSSMLHDIAQDESRERIAIGDLLALMGDRALAALLFVFAVPNVLPVPPGTSTILGRPWSFLPRSWLSAFDRGFRR